MGKVNLREGHIAWVDVLRVLACLMVVMAHACDPFVGQFDSNRDAFLTGTAMGSLMRASVPLFVMMTGVLLLPVPERDRGVLKFYRRRVGRVFWPLLFWSLVLPVIGYVYYNYVNPATMNPLLSAEIYGEGSLMPRMWTWVFNFNYDTTALWYMYMLVGLYLIVPIVNGWLQNASRSDIRVVLAMWGVSLCLPYVQMAAPSLGYEGVYGNFGILGVCDWNMFGMFYYMSGFVGYMILAYYLKTYPLQWSFGKKCAVMIPMFLVGYAVTFVGYIMMQKLHPGDYAYLEILWYFCGINVCMMTVPVFVMAQGMKIRPRKWLQELAGLTFGIYLVHFPFETAGYDLLACSGLPYWMRIVLSALAVFGFSAAIVWLMKQWRVTSKLVS